MRRGFLFGGKKSRALHDHIHPDLTPWQLGWISLCQAFDVITIDDQIVAWDFHAATKATTKILNDEKDIILKQIENTPDDKKEQIVKGKLNKFIKENTLLGQALITDPKNTVSNYLSTISKANNLELNIRSMDLYTI